MITLYSISQIDMHAKMSLQCNEYGSIWQNKATHNHSLLIIY